MGFSEVCGASTQTSGVKNNASALFFTLTLYHFITLGFKKVSCITNMDNQKKENSVSGTDRLEELRENLQHCDEIIMDALLMRGRIIEDIMSYKEAQGMPVIQPGQEARQNAWITRRLQGKKHADEIRDIFRCIRKNSKRIQARNLFSCNIFLIGFMGAGKTTISDYLHTLFAMDVVEMDEVIAKREGMSIPDIFELHGEQYFRDAETSLLIEMQNRSNTVISCGGGVPMREKNVVEMKKNGRVVLLTATPQTILERVRDSHDRPLIEHNKTVEFIGALMEKRREKYEHAADIIIRTDDRSELEICNEIIRRLLETESA